MLNEAPQAHSTFNIRHSTFNISLPSIAARCSTLPLHRSATRVNFRDLIPQQPATHPADGQAIDETAEGAIHRPVFRSTEAAGAMVDRHLIDPISLQANERG